jgi:peptidylprolyl isomerase domain and WD repeat-containing protein 1
MLSQTLQGTSSNNGYSVSDHTIIDDYDAIDSGETDDLESRDEKKVNDAAFAALGDAPLPERNGISFDSKMNTDLYSLLKKKICAVSLAISPTGTHFAVYGSDRKVRLFEYHSGKSIVQYDERMKVYDKQVAKRQASGDSADNGMDAIDYGNRAAREREMGDTTILNMISKVSYQECGNQSLCIQFDPTGRYLVLPTVIGIKVIEWSTNKCRKIIGKGAASTLRFLGGVMITGDAKVDKQM